MWKLKVRINFLYAVGKLFLDWLNPWIRACCSFNDSLICIPIVRIQWNLIRTLSGPAVLSFVERLSSFGGDFIRSVYTRVL